MIHVIASVEVVAGKREEMLAEFHKIVPLVLEEEGCIEYGPAIDTQTDISLQNIKGENILTIIEKWESTETLKAHLAAPHMNEYRERIKEIVVGMTLHILEPA